MTRAAEQLYMTQPAITKTIQKFEAQIGKKLFERSKKGVELTETAKELYNSIAPACEQILEAERRLKGEAEENRAVLRISTMDLAMKRFLAEITERFQEKHREVDISIDLDGPERKLQNLNCGLCDIVIDYDSMFFGAEQTMKKMQAEVLETQEDGAFVTGELKYLAEKEMTLDELGTHTLILPNANVGVKNYYKELFAKHGNKASFVYASGFSLRVELAEHNAGILITVQDGMQKEVEEGKFFPINLKGKLMKRQIIMVAKPKESMTPIAKAFWNEVKEYFQTTGETGRNGKAIRGQASVLPES